MYQIYLLLLAPDRSEGYRALPAAGGTTGTSNKVSNEGKQEIIVTYATC